VLLVLMLEDLHWSDPATVDLLASLAHRRDAAYLLIVGTFRDSEIAGHQHPLRTAMHELHMHRLCEEIHLRLLGEPDIVAYLAARFPAHRFPPGLARLILDRTDGESMGHLWAVLPRVDGCAREAVRQLSSIETRSGQGRRGVAA
jgi:predicted ATPase